MQSTQNFNLSSNQVEAPHCVKCGSCHAETQCTTFVEPFFWSHPAEEVYLIGEWSAWRNKHPMVKKDGYFTCQVSLNPGYYQHRFIVDGKWTHDQTQPMIQNTLGSYNNVKEVFPKRAYLDEFHSCEQDDNFVYVTIQSNIIQEGMKIIGSWDKWTIQRPLHLQTNLLKNSFVNSVQLKLEKGKKHQFKFKNNKGEFFIDEKHPAHLNQKGTLNNYIIASCYAETKTPKTILQSMSRSSSTHETEWEWQKQTFEELQSYNLYGHSLTCIGDMLYIFGGKYKQEFRDYLIKVPLYDMSIFEQQQANIPARAYHTSVADGNKIIIFGGLNTMVLNDCIIYNTATDEWSEPLAVSGTSPSNRQKSTSVLYKDSIIVYGGYFCCPKTSIQIIYNDIHILSTQSMTWSKPSTGVANAPARFAHSATVYQDSMLVFGGISSMDENGDSNQLWKLRIDKDQLTWNKVDTVGKFPSARHGHTANILNHYLVIFAGANNKQVLNDVVMLDLDDLVWITPIISGEIPRAVVYHAAAEVSNQLIVIGGKSSGTKYTPSISILKPKRQRRISFSVTSQDNSEFFLSEE